MSKSNLENIMKEIQAGSKDALGDLYDQTKDDIFRYIYSIVHNKDYASDLVQDTFIQIYRNANYYKNNGHLLAWMITVARNITYMSLRKTNREVVVDYEIEYTDNSLNTVHKDMVFEEMIQVLNEDEREIIVLHIVEDLTFIEIAKVLDMKLPTVLSKYHRSLKKLKKGMV